MQKKGWWAAAAALLFNVVLIAWCAGIPCIGAWLDYGMVVDECPDGEPRVLVNVQTYGLERNRSGNVDIRVDGSWVVDEDEWARRDPIGDFEADLSLVDGDRITPLECKNPWDDQRGHLSCSVLLDRELPDGDYMLRASVETPLEHVVVDVPLPLYRPAHVHVLTDRPLYEPGDTMHFRALMLRKGTLEPLDDRPGRWLVYDSNHTVLLDERSDGGAWGVSASSFPMADDASIGDWTVAFSSGDDTGEAIVRVEPFTLPRFSVEISTEEPWYAPGDGPEISGVVLYNSGAPVADASVKVSLYPQGGWPMPNTWQDLAELETDRYGAFTLELDEIPEDLVDATDISVSVRVTDTDGDTASGRGNLRLSPDPLLASAVTEVQDGLVSDFNNRVYLRVTSPDGRALADTEVSVRNLWDPRDAGKTTTTDADGVAALQLDPGQPVNVVVPALPVRPSPEALVEPFTLDDITPVHRANRAPSIAERRDAHDVVAGLERCSHLTPSDGAFTAVFETRGGLVERVTGLSGSLGECVEEGVRGRRLGTEDGLYELLIDARVPRDITTIRARIETIGATAPGGLEGAITDRTRVAGDCVRDQVLSGDSSFIGVWHADTTGAVSLRWLDWSAQPVPWSSRGCIQRAFTGIELERVSSPVTGTVRFQATAPYRPTTTIPAPTTMHGFEYEVSVEDLGTTTWRSSPGTVPYFRLRPDRVLLEMGSELRIEMLRGPNYSGELPDQLQLSDSDGHVMLCPRTPKALKNEPYDDYYSAACPEPVDDNAVLFAIPEGREGFMRTENSGAQAIVYVRPEASLELEITTAESVYAPGSEATLQIQASHQAVVSLVGVDESLAQLARLPGADELSELAVGASSSSPAWQYMDALALTSGAVRGDNAAMAAILRVDALTLEDREAPYRSGSAETAFDPNEELQSAYWELLGDLQGAVRDWEGTAPEGELLTNQRMAELHHEVLDDASVDAWGRPLELWRLPDELLALCEPRVLVLDATRVPEDVEAWIPWVRTELER